MRGPLSVALVLAGCAASGVAAQDSVRREVTLPSGMVITRTCASWRAEGVAVIPADSRAPGGAAATYFARLAREIERRLARAAPDSTVLVASFAARVMTDGTVNGVRLIRGSQHSGFDMAAQQAASFAPNDPDRIPEPAGMPDSLTVLISFGLQPDGSTLLVPHVRCPAFLLPGSPKPEYPVAATLMRSRYRVPLTYAVDTTGTVDPESVIFLDDIVDAFAASTIVYLSRLRYLPEEFDGERRVAWITRTIMFMPPTEENPETR